MRDVVKPAPRAAVAHDGARSVVPDVWGDSEEVALEKLRLSGFRPGPRREARSSTFVPGTVMRTVPKAGTALARGERVALVVARHLSGRTGPAAPDARRRSER